MFEAAVVGITTAGEQWVRMVTHEVDEEKTGFNEQKKNDYGVPAKIRV